MKYILGIFAGIVLLILVVALIVRGISGNSEPKQSGSSQVVLADYADKPAKFILTTYGPIVAEEEKVTVVVSVSAEQRVIEVIQGYNQNVVFSQQFANSTNAYQTFLSALNVAGYSNVRRSDISDPQGYCPFGKRFTYQLVDGSDEVINTWNASCGERRGTFGGDGQTVRRLFEDQIPDYNSLVNDAEEKIENS